MHASAQQYHSGKFQKRASFLSRAQNRHEAEQQHQAEKALAKRLQHEALAKIARQVNRSRKVYDQGFKMAEWLTELRGDGESINQLDGMPPRRRERLLRDSRARLQRARRQASTAADRARLAHGAALDEFILPVKLAGKKLERRRHQATSVQ